MTARQEYQELRRLLSEGTPGPWMAQVNSDGGGLVCGPDRGGLDVGGAIGFVESDAALIAAMRNALPALLDALDTVEAAIDEARADASEEALRFAAPYSGGFKHGADWGLNRLARSLLEDRSPVLGEGQ